MTEQTVKYSMWTESQCREVFDATLKVLSTTGCLVENEEARHLLADRGCTIEGELVR